MARLAALALLVPLTSGPGWLMAHEPTARSLFSSATTDCALAPGEKFHDGFDGAPREFAAVTVEQRGIEAAIAAAFPSGT